MSASIARRWATSSTAPSPSMSAFRRSASPAAMSSACRTGIDWATAALAEPLACVLNGQENMGVSLGDRVVIIGAGPIGILHLKLALLAGARQVIVVEPSASRRAAAERLGALAIDPGVADVKALVKDAHRRARRRRGHRRDRRAVGRQPGADARPQGRPHQPVRRLLDRRHAAHRRQSHPLQRAGDHRRERLEAAPLRHGAEPHCQWPHRRLRSGDASPAARRTSAAPWRVRRGGRGAEGSSSKECRDEGSPARHRLWHQRRQGVRVRSCRQAAAQGAAPDADHLRPSGMGGDGRREHLERDRRGACGMERADELVVSIGLTGTCPTIVLMDEESRPLRNAILYLDNRGAARSPGWRPPSAARTPSSSAPAIISACRPASPRPCAGSSARNRRCGSAPGGRIPQHLRRRPIDRAAVRPTRRTRPIRACSRCGAGRDTWSNRCAALASIRHRARDPGAMSAMGGTSPPRRPRPPACRPERRWRSARPIRRRPSLAVDLRRPRSAFESMGRRA